MKPLLCLIALSLGTTLLGLNNPAFAQDWGHQQRAQQQLRQQQQLQLDIQHRHHQPGHPGYVGPRGSGSPGQRPGCYSYGCYEGRKLQVTRYILKPNHGALVLVNTRSGTEYEFATGATPAEAEQKALRECRDHDSRARCQIAARLSNACVGVTDGYLYRSGGVKAFSRVYITPVDLRRQAQSVELGEKRLLLNGDAEAALREQAMDMCRADAGRTPGLHCPSSVGGKAFCALDEYDEEYAD